IRDFHVTGVQTCALPIYARLLSRFLSPQSVLVVELGSWLGKSTRFLLRQAPHATVVAIDHWKGSAEHQRRHRHRLISLYETFLVDRKSVVQAKGLHRGGP